METKEKIINAVIINRDCESGHMIEISKNIFTGSEQDFYSIQKEENWAVLHCCKNPFHCEFVGYRGNLQSSHPNYALMRKDNRMALNLVDMNMFSEKYLDFNESMFREAFDFLDGYRTSGYKILIHCNQGESRGPTMAMFYATYIGSFGNTNFEDTVTEFKKIYPRYNPKKNIYMTVKSLWNNFIKEK